MTAGSTASRMRRPRVIGHLYLRRSGYTTVNFDDSALTTTATEPLVLIVDAHVLVASSLATALRHAGFSRVATVDPGALQVDLDGVSERVAAGDLVLVGLLYGDGRTALPLICPLVRRGCRVLVMASDQGLRLTGDCLHMGAEAVLDQAMSFERLVDALRRLSAGGVAMTDDERSALLERLERHQAAEDALHQPFRSLTDREAEVFAALVSGAAPKQIAHRSGITVSTVRGHIHRVLTKLDVSSQREALAMARHAGWPAGS
jgi:two-component system, NarL family, nitrate/nitrite response regulator NarL